MHLGFADRLRNLLRHRCEVEIVLFGLALEGLLALVGNASLASA